MKQPKATYRVLWSRWTGKYEASSSEHPGTVVIDTDPFIALKNLQKLMRLMK